MKSSKANSRLAFVLQSRMKEVSSYVSSPSLELGRITGTMGLKLDSFPDEIPRSDYKICRTLALKDFSGTKTAVSDIAGDPPHSHSVKVTIPIALTRVIPVLKTGDRVLVAWADGEPVVVDVVV